MSFGIRFLKATGSFEVYMNIKYGHVAKAATLAMRDTADTAKELGRASIAAGGLGSRWQKALRAEVYPRGRFSVNAAAFIYHKIKYANIFERGGTIRGKPLLWLPLSGTPRKIGRRKFSPRNFSQSVGKLYPIPGASKPLLGARVSGKGKRKKVSLSALKKGGKAGEKTRLVPLFVGVPSVSLKGRMRIIRACVQARRMLPRFYETHVAHLERE